MTHKFIKLGPSGEQLPDDAPEWVAVQLPEHGLMFTATSVVDNASPQPKCESACRSLDLLGHTDWDIPTVDELTLLIDRSRHSPATNADFFRVKCDWYWTSTAAAWSSASAWSVHFNYGYVSFNHRNGGGFALAVRRAGQ